MPETGTRSREGGDKSAGERLDQAIQGTRDRVGRAVDTARERLHGAMDEARSGVETVKEKFGTLKEKKAGDLVEDTKLLVREHPGTSLVIGIGAGFLLGWLLRGRD